MASISNDPGGRRRILFVAPDGSRKAVRLGKCDTKSAESIARHVESLLGAKIGGQPVPRATAAWLAGIGAKLRDRLAAAGLVEAVQRLAVGEYLQAWLAAKRTAGHSAASAVVWGHAIRDLTTLFGSRPLASLAHADGEAFRDAMLARSLRPTTIHKRLTLARQFLEDAVRLGHVSANPFKHVRHRAGDPAERRAYIAVADVNRIIDTCPNVWWRLLVALARFGGLRIPSEAFSLTWGDVDWERGRLTVPSPKTRCHGKPHRVVPLFPLLRPHLEAAFEQADEGSVYVVPEEYRRRASGPAGWINTNLRTQLLRIIRRAGVEPWPRVWHSLRASCESDLAQSFPLATVTKWLGNTPSVALKHYVDPTEVAFDLAQAWTPAEGGAKSGAPAAQKAAQHATAGRRTDSQDSTPNPGISGNSAISCESSQFSTHEHGGSVWESNPPGAALTTPHRF